ncbi:hypothetical protein [Mesonia aquimarina]|uniref:hypothetical protein n=1 Tax=Mesonia aquimarina TaxID=1504967 RepID=UPI000EF5D35A|nr:hypothetical protein [Mesonia aquimarina]
MKTNYLLPNSFKKWGWIIFLIGIGLGIIYCCGYDSPKFFDTKVFALVVDEFTVNLGGANSKFFTLYKTNFFDELICLLLIIGGLLVAFSKQKIEDEFISKIRVESLIWATYCNYFILLIAILFVYETPFFWVMIFNMFTVLLFFIIRFHWASYRMKKLVTDEE